MESSNSCEAKNRKETLDINLEQVKMIELAETKEEIRQVKENTVQSWLDARAFIDELEKLKSQLSTTKSRILMSNAVVSKHEADLVTIENSIRIKMMMESKLRLKASELNQSLSQTREEMEQLNLEKDKQKRSRTEFEQALKLKKESIKTLQLTLRAVRLEYEAIGASLTGAVKSIYCSETDTTMVELSHEEYCVLMKRAKEENLLADWRASVSAEQRLMAEESRDSVLRKLKEITETKKRLNKQKGEGLYAIKEGEEKKSRINAEIIEEEVAYPKAKPELIPWSSIESSLQQIRRRSHIIRSVQRKKTPALVRMRSFLIQKIATWLK